LKSKGICERRTAATAETLTFAAALGEPACAKVVGAAKDEGAAIEGGASKVRSETLTEVGAFA
jgi:hypothetical protein